MAQRTISSCAECIKMVPKTPKKLAQARELRNKMGVSKKWLWAFIRNDKLGFRFRRQYVAGPYILDFFCPEAMLCIEIDGEQHCENTVYDQTRDCYLASLGIYVLRIPSLDVFQGKTQWNFKSGLTQFKFIWLSELKERSQIGY